MSSPANSISISQPSPTRDTTTTGSTSAGSTNPDLPSLRFPIENPALLNVGKNRDNTSTPPLSPIPPGVRDRDWHAVLAHRKLGGSKSGKRSGGPGAHRRGLSAATSNSALGVGDDEDFDDDALSRMVDEGSDRGEKEDLLDDVDVEDINRGSHLNLHGHGHSHSGSTSSLADFTKSPEITYGHHEPPTPSSVPFIPPPPQDPLFMTPSNIPKHPTISRSTTFDSTAATIGANDSVSVSSSMTFSRNPSPGPGSSANSSGLVTSKPVLVDEVDDNMEVDRMGDKAEGGEKGEWAYGPDKTSAQVAKMVTGRDANDGNGAVAGDGDEAMQS